ncbi:hypothetical protein [Microbacterium sp. No. 7]|uniref:hypothetical protein n=1 Tax=Microbacterium sp. No. 7 TaxID=1714373 RepID=UPI0006CF7EF3|nr:hypothetical protein [Microbacterium sp. No. 7]ALJ19502.1 hypothetical protein AOA12_06110 [Microbacterium sp. No. 7]
MEGIIASAYDWEAIDRAIDLYIGLYSPVDISREQFGGSVPASVIRERAEKVLSVDWLTAAQQEELVLRKLRNITSRLELELANQGFLNLDNISAQLATLREQGRRLDARRAAAKVDVERYSANVAHEMVRAYDIALSYLRGALREQISDEHWAELTTEALLHAEREVMKGVTEE